MSHAFEIPPREILADFGVLIGPFVRRLIVGIQNGPPGWSITSYYRDPQTNAQVGGQRESQHLVGLAIDLAVADRRGLADALRAAGLIAVVERSHVHVQLFPAGVLASAGVHFPLIGAA